MDCTHSKALHFPCPTHRHMLHMTAYQIQLYWMQQQAPASDMHHAVADAHAVLVGAVQQLAVLLYWQLQAGPPAHHASDALSVQACHLKHTMCHKRLSNAAAHKLMVGFHA
jgi:hypothetical protein